MNILVVAENSEFSERVAAAFSDRPEVACVQNDDLTMLGNVTGPAGQPDQAISFTVLDYELPGLNGLKGVAQLAGSLKGTPLALILRGGSLEFAQRAYLAGANAVIDHDLSDPDMAAALRLAERGLYLTLLSNVTHGGTNPGFSQLSERELQVLRGLCDGLQNKEIAHAFSIQEVTVKMHMRSVVRKLGAKNRTHAAMIARDQHLV